MILRGKKIILRTIQLSDAPRFVKWLTDSHVTRFLASGRISLKDEKKWIRGLALKKKEKHFSIETMTGELIGNTVLSLSKKVRDKYATFGIIIGEKKYWNKGYGTEAMKLMLHYGFTKLKLHRIELGVTSFNPRAIHLYKKLGFSLEGIRREHVFYKSRFHDSFLMGILKKEWKG